MKISKDIKQKFSEQELKKLSKNPILFNLKPFFMMFSFFTLFASLVLFIVGGSKGNFVLLYVAIGLLTIGALFLILCFLQNSRSKKIQNRYVYQVKNEILGFNEFSIINPNELDTEYLKKANIFNQKVDLFYSNNYKFIYLNNLIKIYQVNLANLKESRNSIINNALNIYSKDNSIGQLNQRTNQDIPFKGSVIEFNLHGFENEIIEIREIKDSISKSILNKEENLINNKELQGFLSKFEIFYNSKVKTLNINKLKDILNLLNYISINKKGTILLINDNKLYLAMYDNYFNFEDMLKTKRILKLGEKYLNIQKEYLPIRNLLDYFNK